MEVREATFPADLAVVHSLFQEYADGLTINLDFQGFADELAGLPGRYARPTGGVWLAEVGGEVAGCVALRPLGEGQCEIKRLFVRPGFRGLHVGRRLAEQVLTAATFAGYRRVLLDTLPSMAGAITLYRSLGFSEVPAYCHNPVPGALFLGRELTQPGSASSSSDS